MIVTLSLPNGLTPFRISDSVTPLTQGQQQCLDVLSNWAHTDHPLSMEVLASELGLCDPRALATRLDNLIKKGALIRMQWVDCPQCCGHTGHPCEICEGYGTIAASLVPST